jgi:hypothetical protein
MLYDFPADTPLREGIPAVIPERSKFLKICSGEIIRETQTLSGASPPPLGHPHCDDDVLPATLLGSSQEGGNILREKYFLKSKKIAKNRKTRR